MFDALKSHRNRHSRSSEALEYLPLRLSKSVFHLCPSVAKTITTPQPKSTPPHPKSTVDLGCEELIRVENAPLSPLFPGHQRSFNLITTQRLTRANRMRTAAHQKIYSLESRQNQKPSFVAIFPIKPIQGCPNLSKPFFETIFLFPPAWPLHLLSWRIRIRSILSFCQKSVLHFQAQHRAALT
jgi:hypothetical protein